MSTSRFASATLAGGVVIFVLGFLIYGVAMMSFFQANLGTASGVMKAALSGPDYLHLGIGQLAYGAVLTVVLSKWVGASGAGTGFQVGAVIGLMMGLGTSFTMLGTTNIHNLNATLVDPLLFMIQMGCGGAAVGAVLGKSQ